MAVTLKNILLTDKSLFAVIITAITYTILIISLIYGIRKHCVTEIIKNPSIFIFLFITLIESVLYIFERYFTDILPFSYNVIFYINSGIFIIGVIISLIDEKYYTNTFPVPVTICRMSVYLIGLSVAVIMIEIVYVVLVIIGSVFLITAAVWSAVDFNTFKKNILFWRNRT